MSIYDHLDLGCSYQLPLDAEFYLTKSPVLSPLFGLGSLDGQNFVDSYFETRVGHLEETYCSNFSCCGLTIANLHELLDHFEARHVAWLGGDVSPRYPPLLSDCASPPLFSDDDSIQADLALPKIDTYYRLLLTYPRKNPLTTPPLRVRPYLNTIDSPISASSFSYSSLPTASASSSTFSSPLQNEPICLSPSLLVRPPVSEVDSPEGSIETAPSARRTSISTSRTKRASINAPAFSNTPRSKWGSGPPRQRARVSAGSQTLSNPNPNSNPNAHTRMERPSVTAAMSVSTKAAAAPGTDSGGVQTKKCEREKAYKCPHPGCSKSYLNPNGLKYHLEKGTCTIALPVSGTVSASPVSPLQAAIFVDDPPVSQIRPLLPAPDRAA